MAMAIKFPAAAAVVLALAATPVAIAGNAASATAKPTRAKSGQKVQMLVKGMNPGEKVKVTELSPYGQTRPFYPRAGATGQMLVKVIAQVKGKHTWFFTGRSSHRTAKTSYYVTK
jgi:hypothetical protein